MSSNSGKVLDVISDLKKEQTLQERKILCPKISIDVMEKSLYRHVSGEWVEVLCLAENKRTHETDVVFRNIKDQSKTHVLSTSLFLKEVTEPSMQPYEYMSKSELKEYLGTLGVMMLLQKEIFNTAEKRRLS